MPANTIHVSTGLVLHDIEKVGMNLSVKIIKIYQKFIYLYKKIFKKVNIVISCVGIRCIDPYLD